MSWTLSGEHSKYSVQLGSQLSSPEQSYATCAETVTCSACLHHVLCMQQSATACPSCWILYAVVCMLARAHEQFKYWKSVLNLLAASVLDARMCSALACVAEAFP